MTEQGFLRMTVEGLTVDPSTNTAIVLLKDERQEITLPIWIGWLEASSLYTELRDVKTARPLTHDLLTEMITMLGGKIVRVEITEIRDNVFYASIHLQGEGGEITPIDCRPSDAISLALRADAPLFVARSVVEASSVVVEDDGERDEDADPAQAAHDFSEVSPDRWAEILETLDPKDFKYKT